MTDTLRNILSKVPVVPVLTVHGPEDAVPLARALVAGGLTVLEITLRTEGALKAIEALARDVPEAMIGAGTVLTPSQISEAMSAGAGFIVSPGSTVKLAEAAQHLGQRVTRLGVRGRDGQCAFGLCGVFAGGLLDVVGGIERVPGHGDKLAAGVRQAHQPRAVAHE